MILLQRLFWLLLGYLAAVVVATIVTVFLVFIIAALPDQGRFGSVYKIIANMLGLVVVGLMFTGIYAFAGWLISISIAACRGQTGKRYFVVAGGLTAVLAHLQLAFVANGGPVFGITGQLGAIYLWSIIGGLCGGWTYWRVAVVRFGKWKTKQ